MPYQLTDEQVAICDAVGKAQGSLQVRAYAGTGKTSTIEAAAQRVKEPALALAFNKKIADELKKRLPANFQSKTLNGLGFGAIMRSIDKGTPNVDGQKVGKLVRSIAQEQRTFITNEQWDDVKSAVAAAQAAGISPGDKGDPLLEDTFENWYSVIDVNPNDADFVIRLARDVLEADINLVRSGHMSYDDQVYYPTIIGGRLPRFPKIFVDEAQDLSPLNHKMISLCTRDDGTNIMAVGDPRQAIYAFRGADSSSMDSMRWIAEDWEDLALTLTFRCPKAVVQRQQAHAPGYRAYEKNALGAVLAPPGGETGLPEWSWDWIRGHLSEMPSGFMSPSGGQSCAIICRNNAPLLSLAFKLIRGGIGCQMLGRDIGSGLINFTRRITKVDEMPIAQFAIRMQEWVGKECELAELNQKPERAERIRDQESCVVATMEGAHPSTVGDLRLSLEQLFKRDGMPIVLSSGHRSKGLEWPMVIHLDPWRIPSKQALFAQSQGNFKPLEQEYNLNYVTETRTKHTLVNADLETFH